MRTSKENEAELSNHRCTVFAPHCCESPEIQAEQNRFPIFCYVVVDAVKYYGKRKILQGCSYEGWLNTLVSICIWYPLINESSMAQTQTWQLQYLYALNIHLMKVPSLQFFTERLYKTSNIFMLWKAQVKKWLIALILYFQSLSWPLETI